MTTAEKRSLLAERLSKFRRWSYETLAAEIERTRGEHDCLRHFDEIAADGTECQLEFNVFWDDRPGGNVRVLGDLSASPQRPLLRFVPIYVADVTDFFIMAPDGSFVGE